MSRLLILYMLCHTAIVLSCPIDLTSLYAGQSRSRLIFPYFLYFNSRIIPHTDSKMPPVRMEGISC